MIGIEVGEMTEEGIGGGGGGMPECVIGAEW